MLTCCIIRASPSEFVVPLAKYVKAVYHTRVSVGMRFRMLFETEESSVRRFVLILGNSVLKNAVELLKLFAERNFYLMIALLVILCHTSFKFHCYLLHCDLQYKQ